jgi:hypothetical protein
VALAVNGRDRCRCGSDAASQPLVPKNIIMSYINEKRKEIHTSNYVTVGCWVLWRLSGLVTRLIRVEIVDLIYIPWSG